MAETRPDCIALVLKGCEAVITAHSHLAWSGDSQLQQWRLLELSMEVSKPKFATPVVPLILLEHLQ